MRLQNLLLRKPKRVRFNLPDGQIPELKVKVRVKRASSLEERR